MEPALAYGKRALIFIRNSKQSVADIKADILLFSHALTLFIRSLVCALPSHKFIFISNYETICRRVLPTTSERIISICGERKDALSQAFRMVSPSDLTDRIFASESENSSPLQEAHFAFFFAKQKEGRTPQSAKLSASQPLALLHKICYNRIYMPFREVRVWNLPKKP